MKYVYTGGDYAEFRGHVFAHGRPTTITDRATEEALLKRSDFTRYSDEERNDADERENASEGQKALLVGPKNFACPKCGKEVRRGRHMHIKNCRGDEV